MDLFLTGKQEVVKRKKDMNEVACKGQCLLAGYFLSVHTTRKPIASCPGQIAGKGVRVIE